MKGHGFKSQCRQKIFLKKSRLKMFFHNYLAMKNCTLNTWVMFTALIVLCASVANVPWIQIKLLRLIFCIKRLLVDFFSFKTKIGWSRGTSISSRQHEFHFLGHQMATTDRISETISSTYVFQPWPNSKLAEFYLIVSGHRPKTKELLELLFFLLFTIWFISSLTGI